MASVSRADDRRETTLEAIDYSHDLGVEIRGHTLVWPGWIYLPGDLEQNKDDPEYLRKRVNDHVRMDIVAMAGRVVRTLVSQGKAAGCHMVRWDGSDDAGIRVASGIYFCAMMAEGFNRIRKLLLMK